MQQVPISAANPSAAVALKGRPIGITAAGILSSCNPVKGSYKLIWEGVAQGSWLTTLPDATHMSVSWGVRRGGGFYCRLVRCCASV